MLPERETLRPLWKKAHNIKTENMVDEAPLTDMCEELQRLIAPEVPSLRTSSALLSGAVRLYKEQVDYLYEDTRKLLLKIAPHELCGTSRSSGSSNNESSDEASNMNTIKIYKPSDSDLITRRDEDDRNGAETANALRAARHKRRLSSDLDSITYYYSDVDDDTHGAEGNNKVEDSSSAFNRSRPHEDDLRNVNTRNVAGYVTEDTVAQSPVQVEALRAARHKRRQPSDLDRITYHYSDVDDDTHGAEGNNKVADSSSALNRSRPHEDELLDVNTRNVAGYVTEDTVAQSPVQVEALRAARHKRRRTSDLDRITYYYSDIDDDTHGAEENNKVEDSSSALNRSRPHKDELRDVNTRNVAGYVTEDIVAQSTIHVEALPAARHKRRRTSDLDRISYYYSDVDDDDIHGAEGNNKVADSSSALNRSRPHEDELRDVNTRNVAGYETEDTVVQSQALRAARHKRRRTSDLDRITYYYSDIDDDTHGAEGNNKVEDSSSELNRSRAVIDAAGDVNTINMSDYVTEGVQIPVRFEAPPADLDLDHITMHSNDDDDTDGTEQDNKVEDSSRVLERSRPLIDEARHMNTIRRFRTTDFILNTHSDEDDRNGAETANALPAARHKPPRTSDLDDVTHGAELDNKVKDSSSTLERSQPRIEEVRDLNTRNVTKDAISHSPVQVEARHHQYLLKDKATQTDPLHQQTQTTRLYTSQKSQTVRLWNCRSIGIQTVKPRSIGTQTTRMYFYRSRRSQTLRSHPYRSTRSQIDQTTRRRQRRRRRGLQ